MGERLGNRGYGYDVLLGLLAGGGSFGHERGEDHGSGNPRLLKRNP
jgi:hypothetical protein